MYDQQSYNKSDTSINNFEAITVYANNCQNWWKQQQQ